jgi:cytochrome c oxidase subunit 2
MKIFHFLSRRVLLPLSVFLCATLPAFAGAPVDWQLGMQEAASTSAQHIHDFHDLMLYIITAIALFVLLLLIYVIIRFNKHVNPHPQQFSHNVLIEILWTVVPVVILIVIAIPSFRLLYYVDRTEKPELTLKVTGMQWYWNYEYPDQGGIKFDSYMVKAEDLKAGQIRTLDTDEAVVLPVDTNIQILMTGGDVIHSWTVPALGVKIDAIPGRLNETWVKITKPGTYYGQCSEICGRDHSFMPIMIRAVSKDEFSQWAAQRNGGGATAQSVSAPAPVLPATPETQPTLPKPAEEGAL